MKNRIATQNPKRMALLHSQDLFGMKNLVTTMIPPPDSIMMEIPVSLQVHCANSVAICLVILVNELLQILFCHCQVKLSIYV